MIRYPPFVRNKCQQCKRLFGERPATCAECNGYHCRDCGWTFQHTCKNCYESTNKASQATENKYLELCKEVEYLREKLKQQETIVSTQAETYNREVNDRTTIPQQPVSVIGSTVSNGQPVLVQFYESVVEDVMCAICLETLTPSVKLCINGHAVCSECRKKLTKCPICNQYFSNVKMVSLLQKILKALPKKCKNENCGEYFNQGDAHKDFCGYRPTACKLCNWTGPSQEVLGHVIGTHPDCRLYTGTRTVVLLENFDLKEECSKCFPFFVHNQFVWVVVTNNPATETLKISFCIIRCKKLESITNVQVEVKSELDKSVIKRTLNNDFSVGFHCSVIESCVNKSGHLEVNFNFNKSQVTHNDV